MSRVGKNVGTMFGGGAYLAEASSKSDEYSTQDPSGVFKDRYAFLLCRVTLGNMFYITESNIPKIEEALATGRYQTVLGDREGAVGTYREFVVFDQDQIYPEYVVIYTRSYDAS
ncbi:Tnks [Symbiodinium natans]|uniref:Poly [ADP-ribose] polymerase n=1 Tax=Symbiodinium natans TaxID=878477 RepID=A0A812KDY5_9DINO|nr:Tnks [Symbiodinium natans]